MKVLGIETSCDETAVALLRGEGERLEIVCNLIASQTDAHQLFGGVVPEIASRKHLEFLNPMLEAVRRTTGIDWPDLDLVAVTHAPGLVGALMVGVAAAKTLSYAHRIPCAAVNHIEGHVTSTFLVDPPPRLPMLCVVVSGGHTELVMMRRQGCFERIGKTRDDAVGEAFDKVARVLGLPLPGGPNLEKQAAQGDASAFKFTASNLEPSYDFSYSGLKTAAAQAIAKQPDRATDIAASFQASAVRQLARVVARALAELKASEGIATLGLCGGVAANGALRQALAAAAEAAGVGFTVPPHILCTDNAAMIAGAAYLRHHLNPPAFSLAALEFDTQSLLPIGS